MTTPHRHAAAVDPLDNAAAAEPLGALTSGRVDVATVRRELAARRTRAALEAADRGWFVFPVVPGGKAPAWKAWARHATIDPAAIRGYGGWQWDRRRDPHARRVENIGIACRPSGLVVLDLDLPQPGEPAPAGFDEPGVHDGADAFTLLCERHGQPFPWDTHAVSTRRGGLHLYFTATDARDGAPVVIPNDSRRTHCWLLDIKSPGRPGTDGGLVVAAGSFVEADDRGAAGPYRTLDEADPAALPAWLVDLFTAPAETATPLRPGSAAQLLAAVRRRAPYAERALHDAVDEVLSAVPGTRNDTLNRTAYRLGRLVAAGLLPRDLVFDALRLAADTTGPDTAKNAATIDRALTAGEHAGPTPTTTPSSTRDASLRGARA